MTSVERQLEIIRRGCDELLIEAELRDKLKSGRPLRVETKVISVLATQHEKLAEPHVAQHRLIRLEQHRQTAGTKLDGFGPETRICQDQKKQQR